MHIGPEMRKGQKLVFFKSYKLFPKPFTDCGLDFKQRQAIYNGNSGQQASGIISDLATVSTLFFNGVCKI